jgi:hypothetical protein
MASVLYLPLLYAVVLVDVPSSTELVWQRAEAFTERREARCIFFQDELYRPNYYQSLMEFRAQTLERLKKFAAQRFFRTHDYLTGALDLP